MRLEIIWTSGGWTRPCAVQIGTWNLVLLNSRFVAINSLIRYYCQLCLPPLSRPGNNVCLSGSVNQSYNTFCKSKEFFNVIRITEQFTLWHFGSVETSRFLWTLIAQTIYVKWTNRERLQGQGSQSNKQKPGEWETVGKIHHLSPEQIWWLL